jgi:acyl-CoA dehydrogenase
MRGCAASSRPRSASFEGIEEALARIGGNTYMMDAARTMTAGAIDLGEKPSVVSAIVKYHVTERARQVVNDAHGHPRRQGHLPRPATTSWAAPTSRSRSRITVEGANILTRSLIIFGQGAIRCHPYVLKEMEAAREPDRRRACATSTRPCPATSVFLEQRGFRALEHGPHRLALRSRARPASRPKPAATTSS